MESDRDQVFVVDDDFDIRESVSWVLKSVGYTVTTFSSADEFLRHDVAPKTHCLVVDLLLPGMTGLKLCQEVLARKTACAFIVITGNGDVPSAVEAMRMGAYDFLEKPFSRERLLNSVHDALQKVHLQHKNRVKENDALKRLATLTPRERDVLDAVAAGLPTKSIATRLGSSARTVDVHRSRIMQKLGIESPVQLAHFLAVLSMGEWTSFSSKTA